jgi:MFS family permease
VNTKAIILLITNGMIMASGSIFAPVYALFVQQIGGDPLDAGLTYAAYAVSGGIVTLIMGRLTDKLKEKELVMIAGYLIIAAGYFGYAFVNSLETMLIVQCVVGLGEAIYLPSFDGLYSDSFQKEKLASGWSTWEGMNRFVTAAGAVIGGLIISLSGFDLAFKIMGGVVLLSAVLLLALPRKTI